MRTSRFILSLAFAASVALAGARPASAQVWFAPTISWGDEEDLALGARLLINMSRVFSDSPDQGLSSKIDLVIPFEWYVDCKDCSYFELTPGLILPLTIKDFGPYVGAGINFARSSSDESGRDESDVDVGLGLTLGLQVPVGSVLGFGEVRSTAGGAKQTVISIGLQLGAARE